MWHRRYNLVYHIRRSNPSLPSEKDGETELQDIVGLGVFTDIFGQAEGPMVAGPVRVTSRGVVDRVLHKNSPVLTRARQYPDVFKINATRLGNYLAKWANKPESNMLYGSIMPCGPATIQWLK